MAITTLTPLTARVAIPIIIAIALAVAIAGTAIVTSVLAGSEIECDG